MLKAWMTWVALNLLINSKFETMWCTSWHDWNIPVVICSIWTGCRLHWIPNISKYDVQIEIPLYPLKPFRIMEKGSPFSPPHRHPRIRKTWNLSYELVAPCQRLLAVNRSKMRLSSCILVLQTLCTLCTACLTSHYLTYHINISHCILLKNRPKNFKSREAQADVSTKNVVSCCAC